MGSGAGSGSRVDPHNKLRWDRYGTRVGAAVDPPPLPLNSGQKV